MELAVADLSADGHLLTLVLDEVVALGPVQYRFGLGEHFHQVVYAQGDDEVVVLLRACEAAGVDAFCCDVAWAWCAGCEYSIDTLWHVDS